jgi:DNA-binding response OmpR family regulator
MALAGPAAYGREAMSVIDAPAVHAPSALFVGDVAPTDAMPRALADEGFRVDSAPDPEAALARARAVDVIVLDLENGIDACQRLRNETDAYIVAVGGQKSELELVLSLSVGADDFVPRDVRTLELVARVRAMLRRPRQLGAAPPVLRVRELEIDTGAREVRVSGEPVQLSTLEFDLLAALARNPKLTLSREQLLRQVWGPHWFGDDHVIDVHISNLRRKLNDNPQAPRYIRTVRGFGFRIQEH